MYSASGRSKQKARKSTRTGCSRTVLSLAVHPWHGEDVRIVRDCSVGTVWIERELEKDGAVGEVRIVPRTWTSLVPRAAPLLVDGKPVRLDPEAVLELARWIAAQASGEKVALPISTRESENSEGCVVSSGGPRSGQNGARHDRAAADERNPGIDTVVGKAGTSAAARRYRGQSSRRSK